MMQFYRRNLVQVRNQNQVEVLLNIQMILVTLFLGKINLANH